MKLSKNLNTPLFLNSAVKFLAVSSVLTNRLQCDDVLSTACSMGRTRRDASLISATTATGSAIAAAQAAATNSAVFQTTALCLSASFCFLVCITPSMIMLIGKPYWNEPPNETYAIFKSITNPVSCKILYFWALNT